MALSKEDLDTRAHDRAAAEHLHTFRLAGGRQYLVKSRKLEPGAMHIVTVEGGAVVNCDCPGWHYRQSCTHAAAVTRRLEREGKAAKPATDPRTCGHAKLAPRCDDCQRAGYDAFFGQKPAAGSAAVVTPIRGRSQLFREEG